MPVALEIIEVPGTVVAIAVGIRSIFQGRKITALEKNIVTMTGTINVAGDATIVGNVSIRTGDA